MTGVEGYVESAAIGLLVGRFAAAEVCGETPELPPATTALGALLDHITGGADMDTFQPMNINFGLFPPLGRKLRKRERRSAMAARALEDLAGWLEGKSPPTRSAANRETPTTSSISAAHCRQGKRQLVEGRCLAAAAPPQQSAQMPPGQHRRQ
jgi:hypothetical protein